MPQKAILEAQQPALTQDRSLIALDLKLTDWLSSSPLSLSIKNLFIAVTRDMLLCNEIRQILTRIELFLEMWISTVPLFKRYVLPRCSPANYLPSGHFRHQNFHSNCSLILLQQFRSRWWTENSKFNLQQDHYLQRLKNNTRPLLLGIVSSLVYWATVCCLGAADETGKKIQEF